MLAEHWAHIRRTTRTNVINIKTRSHNLQHWGAKSTLSLGPGTTAQATTHNFKHWGAKSTLSFGPGTTAQATTDPPRQDKRQVLQLAFHIWPHAVR